MEQDTLTSMADGAQLDCSEAGGGAPTCVCALRCRTPALRTRPADRRARSPARKPGAPRTPCSAVATHPLSPRLPLSFLAEGSRRTACILTTPRPRLLGWRSWSGACVALFPLSPLPVRRSIRLCLLASSTTASALVQVAERQERGAGARKPLRLTARAGPRPDGVDSADR